MYNSIDEELSFENPEENNFSESMIVDEEDLIAVVTGKAGINEKLNLLIKEIGYLEYTTKNEKNGKKPTIRIRLKSKGPTKPITPPTHCF